MLAQFNSHFDNSKNEVNKGVFSRLHIRIYIALLYTIFVTIYDTMANGNKKRKSLKLAMCMNERATMHLKFISLICLCYLSTTNSK